MATRFSFTKGQFAEIKRLQEAGLTHRQVGAKFDLSERTLRKIKVARTYEEYCRNQRTETLKRYWRGRRVAAERRKVSMQAVWVLVVLIAISLALLGVF